MMKILLVCCTMLLASTSYSQQYFSLSGEAFPNTKNKYNAGGLLLSVGKYEKVGVTVGAGFGVLLIGKDESLVPLFLEAGMIGKATKQIQPYVNAKLGWSVYDGSAKVIGENVGVKGGLYASFAAGAGVKMSKTGSRGIMYIGYTPLMFRQKTFRETTTHTGGLFTIGAKVALVTR